MLGSVCSLIAYTRSWVSDRDDADELGREQLDVWAEAIRRAMEFREPDRRGRGSPTSTSTALQSDPVVAVAAAYERLGIEFGRRAEGPMEDWARAHPPHEHGVHEFALDEFGLDADQVRDRFAPYLERFGSTG